MSQLMKKRFPSITSIDVESDGNTSFLRAARNGQLDKVLEHLKSNIDINTSNANGLNALHLASKDGHVEIVEELLKRGAVVDAATKKGNTALHIASLAGQEEVVKLLVQHGASVNVQSQNGFTPLYMAAQENHDNVVKYLLANGANQSLSTEDGFTPLAVAMQQGHDKVVTVLLENDTRGKIRLPALHIAAKKDDVKAAKLLLENEHNPDVTSKSGFTPLHIASHYGNQQIASLLIQKGADVNYAAKHNITPLHVAAKWGKTNMVALLLEHGAAIESKTRDGLTPLHCAARSGHEQVVDMLLERGAPISSKTKNGLAPLHMAAQGDHVDAARILLYHRAPVDEVTVDYLTALHVAAHCGHVRVAKLLLDRQADANARALNGFTPLHIACKKNRIKVVELLLKHGASIGATTESGLTPLHVASFMGCMNIVIYLLQHDANPDVPTVRGETPLHLAARANQTDIIRILLRNGAQVDARAREQQTPLHIASRLGNVDIVMLLLQHGAKVDNTTKDMYTALHIAAKEGQDEVAAVLLDNGASLDATTKKGFTPLHLASKYGHLKVTKLLLQKEAPVDAQGKNGVTPLHVAAHYDHQNVALLLLDKGASPHATAKNGHTPLHIAARKNQMDIANTLLEYGAQPNAESKAGFTPLHLSAQEGHADMSALLLEYKADPNHEAKNGLRPIHLCAQEDRVPVAEVLVQAKNGADVNAATKGGYTPLHIASHYGQVNMVRFLLQHGADVKSTTSLEYTPLHQAAQQGHANIVNILLEHDADPNAVTTNGQTPLNIAQKLGYITVIETLKVVTTTTTITTTTTTNIEEKYRVQAPELMHETFMSDSEEEGGEDTVLGDQTYRYLTADEMKSLGDDSLPIDVTRDERIDSNRMVSSADSNMLPPQHIEDTISPEHVTQNYVEYIKKYIPDNVDIGRHPINIGFLVSFLVDARGGAMRGCRHSGVRVIVPPRCAPSPTRITCRYVRPQRTPHPPPLMEGEALASRVLELGPVGAKFLGPVIIEVPHFAALRGKEREIVILRSDNGDSWKEHTVDATEEVLNEVLHDSFEAEDLNQLEDMSSGRITRIVTQDFPQYFAVVSRVRQEVHAIGPEGGMVSSTVVPQVQAVFPEGALTKKIKVGLQAQPIDPELTAKLLGHGVAVSPVVTVEPRRRKFHKAITLSMPAPRAHSQGMINQYSGSAPTLRLLCSITGGTTRAQWEDVTGSTPLTFVNDCVSFTTTVSARFWLMDCRNIGDATKMATELYKEAIHVPFMAKFVVFAKRVDPLEARLRVFCMTDDKEDKTLEHQEHFTEVAKSRDVEVLEGKLQYVEFAGNLVPITKSGEQLSFSFRAFRENRLPFSVRVKDQHAEAVSRCLFMKEPKVPKGEPPQQPICILNIVLPDDIVTDTISLTDSDSLRKHSFLSENFDYYRPDPRLADMSNLLGEDWVPLANQLGLTTSEINVIKSEYPDSVAKQAQSMLRMWLSQSGNKAQTNTLENALKRIGREDIIPQCLNVDHTGQTITRIKQEEIGKYRLKKDIDSIDKDVVREDRVDGRVIGDKTEAKRKLDTYDKYSAEEKVVEKSDEEEDAFDKPVAERREQIEKRLSAERTIPASSQRREIVQEITSIKRQSIVEDKIAEVQQKATPDQKIATETTKTTPETSKTTTTKPTTTVVPGGRTVSETVEVKTTIPSDDGVSGTFEKVTTTTVVTETRTTEADDVAHRTAEDAELLEGVTLSLEKARTPVSRLIADEDPRSPKFSKTPPPSPADFFIREQAASVQEWDVTRKPAVPEPKALVEDAAQQGNTTTTAQYLVSNEDLTLDEIPVSDNIFSYAISKPIYDQTNALIQSESRAEPYHPHTQKYYKIAKEEDKDTAKEDKKRKKSILGTIKTFVGKSLDLSDSDSEKSPKKDKKTKKEKKKKKIPPGELPPEVPSRPPRKPKVPTPTDELKYADIPFVEMSPSDSAPTYKPAEITTQELIPPPVPEQEAPTKTTHKVSISIPITDLDDTDSDVVTDNIKDQAKEIVTGVISDGEKAAKEQIQKSPKMKKQKIIVVDEIVQKTFAPAALEEEEFSIIIDPTRKGSQKKTKETFTINIDESINQIEKKIMEKSPILSDETLIKPIAKIEGPIRPPRLRDHVYEDIGEPQEVLPSSVTTDIKIKTNDLIQNESALGERYEKPVVTETVELKEEHKEKITDSQKMKRKHGKLFGLFGKSKDAEESDDDSKKEVIEKHDKETSKEQESKIEVQKSPKLKKGKSKEKIDVEEKTEITEPQRSPKKGRGKDKEDKGFLGLFKKGKKEEEPKPAFSDTVIKDMIESTAFLKEEVDKYHDVRLVMPIVERKPKVEQVQENLKLVQPSKYEKDVEVESKLEVNEVTAVPSDILVKEREDSKIFLQHEVDRYHDARPILTKLVIEDKEEPKDVGKGFFDLFKKKSSEEKEIEPTVEKPTAPMPLSQEVLKQMEESDSFLKDEINFYHDVRPIIKETIPIEIKTSPEKSKKKKKDDAKGFFGIFKKKPSEERDIEPKTEKITTKPVLSAVTLEHMKQSDSFLKDEIQRYHDVRPVVLAVASASIRMSPEKSSDKIIKDEKEESKSLFALFKKKPVEKELENAKVKSEQVSETTVKYVEKSESRLKQDTAKLTPKKLVSEKKVVHVVQKATSIPILSEQVIKDITDSESFLKDEVDRYHDVRPIIKSVAEVVENSPEKDKKEKSGKGLFGLFKKGVSEDKDIDAKTKESYLEAHPTVVEKVTITTTEIKSPKDRIEEKQQELLSENATEHKNSFLKDEVEKYHDVRVIGKDVKSDEHDKHKENEGKGLFGLFKKKSSEEKETEPKFEKSKEAPVMSEQVIKDMAASDTFLKDEIERYHDVRPVVKNESIETQKSPDKPKKEQKDQGKGFFGLFKKKTADKVAEPIEEHMKTATDNIHKDSEFLRKEVDKEHDVRPIVEHTTHIEATEQPVESGKHSGLFDLFKKKFSEGKEIEPLVEKETKKPVLSEAVAKDMIESDTFLRDEVEKYHDVRPVIKQTILKVEEHKEEGKGLFGLFKKKSSEEREMEPHTEKGHADQILSEQVREHMTTTSSFLNDEIERYHDVRPVIKEVKKQKSPEKTKKEGKEHSKGLFGLFKIKSDDKDEVEAKIEKTEERIVIESAPSEDFVKAMLDSDSFLKDEIEVYHDVRPIIKETMISKIIEKDSGKKDEMIKTEVKEKEGAQALSEEVVIGMAATDSFLKDELDVYHDVRPVITMDLKPQEEHLPPKKEKKEHGKSLFGIFKKKTDEKYVERNVEKVESKAVLSENVLQDMHDTNTFLNDEVNRYHDVRPIIKQTEVIEKDEVPIQKPFEEKKSELTVEKSKDKPLQKIELTIEKTTDQLVLLSENAVQNIIDSESFLKDEVEKYHDVRPIVQKAVQQPEILKSPKKGKKGLFGLFKKKFEGDTEPIVDKTEDNILQTMHETDSFLKDEVDKYHDVRPIIKTIETEKHDTEKEDDKGFFGIFKKKPSEEREVESIIEKATGQPILLSENVVKNMIESDTFLKGEVDKYHDVRPIVKDTTGAEEIKLKQGEDESKGLFGLFNKKSGDEKEAKIEKAPLLSEQVIKDMSESDSFLKDEVELYHDVRPVIKKDVLVEEKQTSLKKEKKQQGKGLFGLFKKKTEAEPKIEKTESKAVLSENVLQNMQDTDSFLKDEVDKYHDVRPIIKQTDITEKIEVGKKKPSEGKELVEKSKDKSLQKLEVTIEKTSDKPVLISENVVQNMVESDSFLKEEVEKYNDVRPIIKKSVLPIEEQKSPKKGKKERGIDMFGIFKKKSEDDVETAINKTEEKPVASESIFQTMHETDSFLKDEIDKYHDVRPIIKQTDMKDTIEIEEDEGKGFLGIFKKKPSVEKELEPAAETSKDKPLQKTELIIEKTSDKPVLLSENVQNTIESDSFLKEEVEKYHDVRPIIKKIVLPVEEQKSPKKEKKEHGKGLFGIFKKKTEDDVETTMEKSEDKPLASESIFQTMHETDTFLKDEIDNYHDVRPIIKQTHMIENIKTEPDEGKGFLGIFKKKSSVEKELEPAVEKSKEKPLQKAELVIEKTSDKPVLLSENVVQNMIVSDSFLKEEVEKYHDVRPIIKTPALPAEVQKSPKKGKKEHGKGLFGIFKKKSEEDTEPIVEKIEDKPVYAENILQTMHETDTFLKDEVSKYHDVRPIVRNIGTENIEMEKDDGKGFFGIFKKKPSEEREVEPTIQKTTDKPILLSENVAKNVIESGAFLKEEVDKHHDVRPVIKQTTEVLKPKDEVEFYHDVHPVLKTDIQRTEIQQSPKKEKKEHSKGLFGLFKKKTDDKVGEPKAEEKVVFSQNVLQVMHETDSFLKDEVDKYHDVRPVVKPSAAEIHLSEKDDSTGLLRIFKKKPSQEREVEISTEKLQDSPALLSEIAFKNIIESDTFLKEEVGKYHDVRPIVKKVTETEKLKTEQTEAKGLFGMYKKKSSEEREIDSKLEKAKEAPVLSEQFAKDKTATDSFLNDEVQLYHDVRPIIEETITVEVAPTKEQKEKKKEEGKGLFGIFTKKPSEEKDIEIKIAKEAVQPVLSQSVLQDMNETDSFLRDEVEVFHDVRPVIKEISVKETQKSPKKSKTEKQEGKGLFGIFKKKSSDERDIEPKKTLEPLLSETAVKLMAKTGTFLQDEITYFHDVRPLVEKTEIVDVIKSPEKSKKEKKGEGKGLFGIFKKKSSEEREIESEITKELVLSEECVQNMNSSNTFLKDEVEHYHDVRPIIKEVTQTTEKPREDKVEGKGIFGKFKKKPSADKEVEPKIVTAESVPVLSGTSVKHMQKSDNFLKDEVELFHDARPVVTHPEPEAETTEKSKKDKGFLGLFKKKPSEDKEAKTEKQTSETTLKNMQDSFDFLNEEVDKYNDVRPITETLKYEASLTAPQKDTKLEKTVTETVTTAKYVNVIEDPSLKEVIGPVIKETITITNIETTEKPKEKDVELIGKPLLSGPTVQAMNDSDAFLKAEIERFHDVRPLIETTVTEDKIEKGKKAGFLGLFKKKPSEENELESKYSNLEETVVSESAVEEVKGPETEDRGGFFGLFKKKHVEEPKVETTVVISEKVRKDMNETNTFLKDEIGIYHDVRPVTKEVVTKAVVAGTEIEKEEQGGILSIFKKSKHEKREDILTDAEKQNIPETTNFLNTELERYDDAVYTKPEPIMQEQRHKSIGGQKPPVLSETTIADMINTSNFIREEVSKYHDVRPVVQRYVVKQEEEKSGKGGKIFSLFGKRRSQDRESSVEADKKSEKKLEKEKKKSKSKEGKTKQTAAELAAVEIKDSKDFHKGEIDRYQDSEELAKFSGIPPQDVEESTKEKSGFFGLFSKKTKPQENLGELKTSEGKDAVLKHITDTDDFIKTDTAEIDDILPQDDVIVTKIDSITATAPVAEIKKVHVTSDEFSPTTDITVIKEMTATEDRVTTKQKEIVVFTDTLQLDPSVFSDVLDLEKEIQRRLQETRGEIDDDIIREMEEIVFEDASDEQFVPHTSINDKTKAFLEQELIQYDDVKPIMKKETSETESEQKSSLFGLFGKRKSQEKELSQEKYVKLEEHVVPESPKIKKKTGSPLKIFGKKHSQDDKTQKVAEGTEMTPVILSDEALKKILDTNSFLSTELENYEDGKPEIITDLDEDTEQVKSSGLFGIFSKKDKGSSPKVPKKKFRKQKSGKSVEDVGYMEKMSLKVTGTEDEILEKGEHISKTAVKETEDVLQIAKDITKDTIQQAEQLIDKTGQEIKPVAKKVSFTGLKEDVRDIPIEISEGITEVSDDAFKDFSEAIEKELETAERESEFNFEGIKVSGGDLLEEQDDLLDKIQERVDGVNKTLDHVRDQTQEKFQDISSDIKDAKKDTAEKIDNAKETVAITVKGGVEETEKASKKAGGFFTKLGEKISIKSETVKDDLKTVKDDAKVNVNDLAKRATESVQELKQSITESSKPDSSEPTEKKEKDKKLKKSFFSKLSGKIGSKGDEIKDTKKELQKTVEVAKSEAQDFGEDVNKELKGITTPVQEARKSIADEKARIEETSSFVTEIMQSFDDTLEHVKDEELATKDLLKETKQEVLTSVDDIIESAQKEGTEVETDIDRLTDKGQESLLGVKDVALKTGDSFLQKVDEKFSATMKLTEQMALESKHKFKGGLSSTEQFLVGERESEEENLRAKPAKVGKQVLQRSEQKLESEATKIKEDKETVLAGIKTQTADLSKDVQEVATDLKNTVELGATSATDSVKETTDDLKENVAKAGKKTGSFFSKLTEKISGKSKEIEKDVKDAESKAESQIAESKSLIEVKSDDLLSKSKSAAQGAIKKTEDTVTDLKIDAKRVSEVVQTTDSEIKHLKDGAVSTSQKVVHESKDLIKDSIQTSETAAKDLKDGTEAVVDRVKEIVQESIQTSKTTMEDFMDSAKDTSQKRVDETKELIKTSVQTSEKAAKDLKDDVKDTTVKSMDETRGIFVQLSDYLSGKTKEVEENVDELMQKTEKEAEGLTAGVAIAVQNVEDAVGTSASKIQEVKATTLETTSTSGHTLTENEKKAVDESVGQLEDLKEKNIETVEKTSKKGKAKFLGKLGKKLSGKGEELNIKLDDDQPLEVEKKDKKGSFLSKLGDKIAGKTETEKQKVEKTVKEVVQVHTGHLQGVKTDNDLEDLKKRSLDLIESESMLQGDSMTRTTSDYSNVVKESVGEASRRISEANIDLSNLPTNFDEYISVSEKRGSSYVTSPTMPRRAISQRFPHGERPEVVEIRNFQVEDISDDEFYIVTEPEELLIQTQEGHRKPLFHISSEDDENADLSEKIERMRYDSSRSNVLEALTESKIDTLLSDLTRDLSKPLDIKTPLKEEFKKEEQNLQEHRRASQAEVDLIEKKLRDLDKALDSLEQIDSQIEPESDKKLRRVERKFDRMASDVMDKESKEGKQKQMTSPEIEDKRETEYRQLVSQLSTEEISDFQREYGHLWDEHTFSKSDDWDSKTPESQADAQELPQGGETASTSVVRDPAPPPKAEGEEAEKEEGGSERKVADQHQLSEEMKELLKELEKESKQ